MIGGIVSGKGKAEVKSMQLHEDTQLQISDRSTVANCRWVTCLRPDPEEKSLLAQLYSDPQGLAPCRGHSECRDNFAKGVHPS